MIRAAVLTVGLCAMAHAADVRIAVFGLFHPKELDVVARNRTPVRVRDAATFAGPDFILRVPGRIERRFQGHLKIVRSEGELIPVVSMDLETAVAAIVAAESPPGAAIEGLKAQAVAARSYLVAGGTRHAHSDFCDTTHCQFMREPALSTSAFAAAARATQGIVLRYDGRVVEALYSADCGGRTRTLAEARLIQAFYPYFAVECPAATGAAEGHRVGLCQRGSAAMARSGATWKEILAHYFPGSVASGYR